jgi:hypothetical protein
MRNQKLTSINFVLILVPLILGSCGSPSRDRENYGDLSSPAGAIKLDNPEKHMGGYGRHDCLVCHNAVLNIHRREGANIDIEQLNANIRNGGESSYCLICHGRNGIPE